MLQSRPAFFPKPITRRYSRTIGIRICTTGSSNTAECSERVTNVGSEQTPLLGRGAFPSPPSFPIRKPHSVSRSSLGSITRHVVDLMKLASFGIHCRNHWKPILDLGCSRTKEVLR